MDGRIAHLRGHYRIQGAHGTAPSLGARLDRVLRQGVVQRYEEVLQQALGDDESVYVLRRVAARSTLMLSADVTDHALARSWGSQLASAVIRAIAGNVHEPGNLVRFENRADHVAHFLVALLNGNNHDQWFFSAFAELSALDRGAAIKRALLDNREHFPAILSYLHRYGELDSLVSALDAETKRALWFPDSNHHSDFSVSRSLFLMALQFVDRLEVWARIPEDGEDLFRDYLATGPAAADWRDPRSLAISVFSVVRFLLVRDYLAFPSPPEEFFVRLSRGLADFEWLDREWLRTALVELFERIENSTADQLPVRPLHARATPRQQELISALASSLGREPGLVAEANPAAAALKLFAVLIADAPHWAEDAAAKVIIDNLITVRSALREIPAPAEFVRLLRGPRVEDALCLLPPPQRERASDACRFLSRLGEPALELLEKLSGESKTTAAVRKFESDCAGLSLLLRPMLDIRLHLLADEVAYPPKSDLSRPMILFLLLALRVGAESAVKNGCLDAGLSLLAGLDEAPGLDAIRGWGTDLYAADHMAFQAALLKVAAGQGLLQPTAMHVFRIELSDGRRALVAGDESATLWPLGRVVRTDAETETAVRDWQAAWEDATGIRPRVISADSSLSTIIARMSEGPGFPADEETQATYDNGRKALGEALEVLKHGETGDANLDLTVTIVVCLLLRVWARWLRSFSTSSVPFLIENFVSRRGRIAVQPDGLVVELERRPLDIIVEMAGYLSDLDHVPWLPGGCVKFLLEGA